MLLAPVSARAAVDVLLTPSGVVIDASDVTAQDVVQELAKESGAELRGRADRSRTRRFAVKEATLEDALRRVVPGQSFVVRYASDGRVERIELVGDPGEERVAASPPMPAPVLPRSDVPAEPPRDADGSSRSIRVPPRLSRSLGASRPRLDAVVDAMSTETDPKLRGEALRAIASSLGELPEVASSLFDMLEETDDVVLTSHLRALFGEDALRVTRQIARRTDMPLLSERFRGVEWRLAGQDGEAP